MACVKSMILIIFTIYTIPLHVQQKKERLVIWGHYSTKDFIHFKVEPIAIKPDQPWDKDGIYSGSSLYENHQLSVFYTGNVRYQGDYDYIHDGRQQNVMMTTSKDGIHFSSKQLLLTNDDFPCVYDKTCQRPTSL